MDPQRLQAMLALERSLHAALDAAQAAQQLSLARLDDSRRLVARLFENEAAKTALYVEDTRLEMRALRDVVQLEMDRARREVATALDEAKRNVTETKAARDAQRKQLHEKTEKLQVHEQQRRVEREQELARVKRAAATEAARIWDEIKQVEARAVETTAEQASSRLPVSSAQQLVKRNSAKPSLFSTEPFWVLPFLVSLLMCSCLWLAYATYRERHATTERRKRVLYSEPLQNQLANGSSENASPAVKSVESSPVTNRQPTLQRRLRPGWSPAVSTASTVSSPDTSSIFTAHASLEASTPSPFGS